MSREGLDRAADALLRFRSILDALPLRTRRSSPPPLCATLPTAREAVFQLQERTGLMIRLLSGREEAILNLCGGHLRHGGAGAGAWCWTSAAAHRVGLLLSGQDTPRLHPPGLPDTCITAVWGTLLPSPKEQAKIRKQVKRGWTRPLPDFPCPVICGVGGTIRRGREAVQLPLQAARRQPHHHPEHGGRPPGALLRSR